MSFGKISSSISAYQDLNWAKSALGRDIPLYASHALDELKTKQPIIMMGGVHGDEPEGVHLAQETLNWLKGETKKSHPTQPAPWVLIPCLNVDGFASKRRVNGNGIDLNRNYPSHDWSPHFEKERYFPGLHPGSESEVKAVVQLIENLQPRLLIHFHSWKPCIVASGPSARPDAERLSASSGYEVVDEIGYPTPGSLSSYGWHDRKIPVICVEEQEQIADASSIWPRFSTGMMQILSDLSLRGPSINGKSPS